jgi:hypothetical protein
MEIAEGTWDVGMWKFVLIANMTFQWGIVKRQSSSKLPNLSDLRSYGKRAKFILRY